MMVGYLNNCKKKWSFYGEVVGGWKNTEFVAQKKQTCWCCFLLVHDLTVNCNGSTNTNMCFTCNQTCCLLKNARSHCPLIETMPEEGLPSSLSSLKISMCPMLGESCEREKGKDWPKISHIPNIDIRSFYWGIATK